MGLDDLPDNGEAQSRSFFINAAGGIRFIKTIPDSVQILRSDADAFVGDGDLAFAVAEAGL